jgi:hypothetical protein
MPRIIPLYRLLISTLISGVLMLALTSCTGPTQVISTDLTRVSGVYLIAYVDREDVRRRLEDAFVAQFDERGLRAVPSHPDLEDIKRARVRDMVQAANRHDVAAIVIVNRVAADGSGGIIESENRILPEDLPAYYASVQGEADDYGNDEPIYAEANGFLVDGNKTRRFWTGTTWTLAEDEEVVIDNVAGTIAEELARVSREMRDYSRPIQ